MNIDELDRRLLASLQEDNLRTVDALAERLGRSPSAIARRLRRLRATGAIKADVSLISEEAAGSPLSAIVHIQLERHTHQEYDFLRRQLVACSNVQLCLEISGDFDVMLLVVTADMEAFNCFSRVMLVEQPAVRRFETSFVKKRAKATLALPLELMRRR